MQRVTSYDGEPESIGPSRVTKSGNQEDESLSNHRVSRSEARRNHISSRSIVEQSKRSDEGESTESNYEKENKGTFLNLRRIDSKCRHSREQCIVERYYGISES